jgi:hypothetical protein
VEEHGVRRGEVDVADAAHLVHGREEPCGGPEGGAREVLDELREGWEGTKGCW